MSSQCTFKKANGEQCKRQAMVDDVFCAAHRETRPREGQIEIVQTDFDRFECDFGELLAFEPRTFFSCPNEAIKMAHIIKAPGLAVYYALCSHIKRYEDDGVTPIAPMAWPSLDTIASEAGLSKRAAQDAIKLLERQSMIVVVNRWIDPKTGREHYKYKAGLDPTSNLYYFLAHRHWKHKKV